MPNVIAFLETMGRDAAMPVHGEGFAAAVDAAGLDDRARAALLARDAGALADQLGGRPRMICALFPADDDQQREDGDTPQGDEPDETPDDERSTH